MARRKSLSEKDVKTIIAVFSTLGDMGYLELNKFLGSETIDRMYELEYKLKKWAETPEMDETDNPDTEVWYECEAPSLGGGYMNNGEWR